MKRANRKFLSCLCGSQLLTKTWSELMKFSKLPIRQSTDEKCVYTRWGISKLPIRQSTPTTSPYRLRSFSKLPIRQSTCVFTNARIDAISKLPIRQSTMRWLCVALPLFSKLPIRQSTAEESERASAPSRETPSPSILPKVSTGRKKSR